ncbi:MAG: DNA polymerase/3'-5' exonuclease PolX [bacterium]
MPIHNTDVASILYKVADLLEIEGANIFRVRAYRNVARIIGGLSRNVADMVAQGEDLSELPGIGKDLAGKITEIVQTGTLSQLKEIEAHIPPALQNLMQMSTLGPKRVQALYEKLNIRNTAELEQAAKDGRIRQLPGFGPKIEQKILEEIEHRKGVERRTKLVVAEEIARSLVDYLKRVEGVDQVIVAGSFRRRKEVVGDLDILATCRDRSEVMQRFIEYEDVHKVISRGETRSTVILRNRLQVDLRVVAGESYGAALHYFTGSQAHNIAIRKLGLKRGLKINEYGVFKGDERMAGSREDEIFSQVGLPYIEPELREDRGEIEAAQKNQLPRLITLDDIRGDLHAHTKATDGRFSLEEMARAALGKGYEYLAITDHSRHVTIAHGLDEERLLRHIEEIDRLNEKLDGIRLLKGIELDILADGSLDLPDDILKLLDIRVCSVHYKFNLPREEQTERIIRAMDNPYFNILAHPTGRLINEREPYEVDLERIIWAARERGCFLEVNAHPDRLDLTDMYCRMAKDMGVKVAISTDAHSLNGLEFMRFGVGQARRGWLEAEDVLNTRRWNDLHKLLKRK